MAANPVNDRMMHLLRGRIDRYRHLSVTADSRPRISVSEHEEILTALTYGDTEAAKRAMDRHILAGRNAVLVALAGIYAPAASA